MMDYVEVKAKTVDDAIIEASIQLETSSDNIEYEVIQQSSSGFLGIGSKPAIIRAKKKEEYSSLLDKEEVVEEVPAKDVKKPAAAKAPKESIDHADLENKAIQFLNDTFKAMNMEVMVKASFDKEESLNIDLEGPEMGILIGKRGQTLDAVQYLTSLVVNKENGAYIRVKVDTEDYRRRRKETLENLAKNIASKVKRTRRPVFLEPMNPYERRIIHSVLQNHPYVSTHSEGKEPYRKVVVTLKK